MKKSYNTVIALTFLAPLQVSKSKNQQFHYRVTPDHFTTLKTGRLSNNNIVEAIVFKAGKRWISKGNERNFALIEFDQNARLQ